MRAKTRDGTSRHVRAPGASQEASQNVMPGPNAGPNEGEAVTLNKRTGFVLLLAGFSLLYVDFCRADSDEDRRLKERLQVRLTGQVSLHVESLGIEVQDSMVRLSGTVGSLGEKVRTERLASGIVGIQGI